MNLRVLKLIAGLRLLPVLVTGVLSSGCVQADLGHSLEEIGAMHIPKGFERARRDPLNARAHLHTALYLLGRANRTQSDILLARSGFQTASRLAPDLWEPRVGLAAAHYRLGEYRAALQEMAAAVATRGKLGELAIPLALIAYRAQEPELARLAYQQAQGQHNEGTKFLMEAFSGSSVWVPQPQLPARHRATLPDEERNVIIEAFMIRDTRSAAQNAGLNLLESLELNFSGTIVNLTFDREGYNGSGDVAVTLPGVSYSLNLASRDLSQISLEASPLVIARQGSTSKFFEGSSVLIVPRGDDTESIERDVGVVLEVTPDRIGKDDVDLTVALELSNISNQSLVSGNSDASVLQTDKSRIEAVARVPYQKAMIVGSAGALTRRTGENDSLVRARTPGLSTQNASASKRDVLVLISVRRPDDDWHAPFDANQIAQRLFGIPLPKASQYGAQPSNTPDPGIEKLLLSSIHP